MPAEGLAADKAVTVWKILRARQADPGQEMFPDRQAARELGRVGKIIRTGLIILRVQSAGAELIGEIHRDLRVARERTGEILRDQRVGKERVGDRAGVKVL